MAIAKALQAIKTIKINKNIPRTIIIHTDSRITLDSLKNKKNQNYLIEEIRKKTTTMEKENWITEYTWIKGHAGHYGNELADKLAKEATRNKYICYNNIPKSGIEHQEREKSIEKWQLQWDATTKGLVTKEYFPNIKERLKMKLRLSPNFTAMLTAHGKNKAYLHRFKIIQSPECICEHGDQTTDHLIYDCEILYKEREKLIAYKSREEDWPVRKCELVNKYLKQFTTFANSIDYEKLWCKRA